MRSFIGHNFICAAVVLGSLLFSSPAAAQEGGVDELYQMGSDWLQENLPEDVLEYLEPPTEEDWNAFWADVQETLQSQSLDDLAWMLPYAQTALEYLRTIPEGKAYADWLQQKLDYFDMARNVMRALPTPQAPPTPRQPARGRVRLAPPPRPRYSPPSAPLNQRRLDLARNRQTWQRKLASRPPPPDAQALVPKLKDVFATEGVPSQWVWLAEVESSMDPSARSPVGAAGLFQFMPATAQRFGLRTRPADERLVPEKSARAAAKYLKVLHRQFNSWPLALAAYNAGEGNVARALKKSSNKTFEGIQDFLPLETQMYVPKVLATVALREGIDPAALPPPTALRVLPGVFPVVAWSFKY
ncbi:MAG: lytic transglycosylase domain-containing protein [Verrucomicrobiota bacterium]